MKVYIAGPMTGKEFYNVEAFREAQARWLDRGWDAHTPFEANSRAWHRVYGRDFDPYTDVCDYGSPLLPLMFAEDLHEVCTSDAIALLPGWEKSKGVARELAVALLLGKRIYNAETFQPLYLKTSIIFYALSDFGYVTDRIACVTG